MGTDFVNDDLQLRRVRIGGIMTVIAVLAVCIASLRGASSAWVGVVFALTIVTLLSFSLRGVLARHEASRLWCVGFSLFGWAHLLLAGSHWQELLPTDWLGRAFMKGPLAYFYPFPTRGPNYSNAMHSANNEYWRAATELVSLYLTLVIATFGGQLTAWLAARSRRRGDAPEPEG